MTYDIPECGRLFRLGARGERYTTGPSSSWCRRLPSRARMLCMYRQIRAARHIRRRSSCRPRPTPLAELGGRYRRRLHCGPRSGHQSGGGFPTTVGLLTRNSGGRSICMQHGAPDGDPVKSVSAYSAPTCVQSPHIVITGSRRNASTSVNARCAAFHPCESLHASNRVRRRISASSSAVIVSGFIIGLASDTSQGSRRGLGCGVVARCSAMIHCRSRQARSRCIARTLAVDAARRSRPAHRVCALGFPQS